MACTDLPLTHILIFLIFLNRLCRYHSFGIISDTWKALNSLGMQTQPSSPNIYSNQNEVYQHSSTKPPYKCYRNLWTCGDMSKCLNPFEPSTPRSTSRQWPYGPCQTKTEHNSLRRLLIMNLIACTDITHISKVLMWNEFQKGGK